MSRRQAKKKPMALQRHGQSAKKFAESDPKAGYWASVLELLCFLWCFLEVLLDFALSDGDADVAGDGTGVAP